MNRILLTIAFGVAIALAISGYLFGLDLLSDLLPREQVVANAVVFQTALALAAAAIGLILVITGSGIFLSVKLEGIKSELSALANKARRDGHIPRREFLACFEEFAALGDRAERMAEEAWIDPASAKDKRGHKLLAFSSDAETTWHKNVLVGQLYPGGSLSLLAWVVVGGALVVVAMALRQAALAADNSQLLFGLAATSGVVVSGFVALIANEALDRALRDRIAAVFAAIDRVLPIADGRVSSPANQTLFASLLPDPTRDAVDSLSKSISKSLKENREEIKSAIETSNKSISKAVASAVQSALSKPMQELSTSTRELTKEQSSHIDKVVKNAVSSFSSELDKQLGKSMKELGAHLSDVTALTKKLQGQITDTIDTVSKDLETGSKAASEQYTATLERLSKELTKQNDAWGGELKSIVDTLSQDIREVQDDHREALKKSAQTISDSGADVRASAEAFEALRDTLESLVGLVGPILRQSIQNQEKLLKALESESAASQVIERAASDMHSASQASRETLEHFLGLAERLSEASRAMRDSAGARAKGSSGRRAQDAYLTDAIRELRDTASLAKKDLPKIGEN